MLSNELFLAKIFPRESSSPTRLSLLASIYVLLPFALSCPKHHLSNQTQNKFTHSLSCMSRLHLSTKLQPIKKGYNSLKNHLKSKLGNTKFVKTVTSLGQHCTVVWQSILRNISRKFRPLTHRRHFYSAIYVDELFPLAEPMKAKQNMVGSSTSGASLPRSRPGLDITSHHVEKLQQSAEKESTAKHEKGLAAGGKGKEKGGESSTTSKIISGDQGGGKMKIPSLPQFRGIDERAEEFINKFRQDMKLEREKSILDFQEMLKRSA